MPSESTFRKNFHDQFQGQLLIDGWLLYMIRESYTQKCHDNFVVGDLSLSWAACKGEENCRKIQLLTFVFHQHRQETKFWGDSWE